MEIAEVQDEESLRRYLEALPKEEQLEVSLRVAFRAATLILPRAVRLFSNAKRPVKQDLTGLPLFGSLACAGIGTQAKLAIGLSSAYAVAVSSLFEEGGASEVYAYVLSTTSNEKNAERARASVSAVSEAGFAAASAVEKDEESVTDSAVSVISKAAIGVGLTTSEFLNYSLDFLTQEKPKRISAPFETERIWNTTHKLMQSDTTADWSFWIAWYERVLAGLDTLPDELAPIFNRLTEEDWKKGPAHINPMFDDVLAMYRADDVAQPLAELTMPPGEPEQIAKTKSAMERHRRELPANFDAILGYIILEIQRLQDRNYRDDADRDESVRQIGVLKTLHQAILRLTMLIPETEDMPQEDAVAAESLVRLYVSKFKEWPRANADEMVDNSCRFALVGLSAMTLPMLGVSATVATVAGAAFFGGERILKNIISAKDVFKPDAG